MKNFQIYKHPFYGFECVKIGFSWPAFFFGVIWMLFSRLWLSALLWLTIYALITYALSNQIANFPILAASLVISITLWLIPAFEGNYWRLSNLQKRGYALVQVAQASSKEQAIAIALNSNNTDEKSQNEQTSHLGSSLFFEKNANQTNGLVSAVAFISIVAGVATLSIATKPNDAAFLSYLLNGDRIQSEITSQINPGDTLSAMALLEDIFSIAASGNFQSFAPEIQKKDYHLFVLYSAKTDIKPSDKTLNNFSEFKKVDAAHVLGFNSTYIGFMGTFFRLKNEPIEDGVQVNFDDKKPDTTRLNTNKNYVEKNNSTIISFEDAVSILSNLPDIIRRSNEIIKASNGKVHPQFISGIDEETYEEWNGSKYYFIDFAESHDDHLATLDRFLVSIDGKKVLIWDYDSEIYVPVKSMLKKEHAKKNASVKDTKEGTNTTPDSVIKNSSLNSMTETNEHSVIEENDDSPKIGPSFMNNPAPEYPRLSQRAGEEGQVQLKVLVSIDGLPETVEIEKSSGYERLDNAAINAVKQWKFKPAQKGNKAVSAYIKVPLTFKLD